MPVTRSRAASLTRRDDAGEAFPDPSRPNTPLVSPAQQDGGDTFSSPRAEAATFSGEHVASIIATLQRSQTEAFRELLHSVSRANASTPESLLLPGQGTLARCKATFSGHPNESVEAFIDAVEAYSDCAQVTDSNILRGLAYLFKDQAGTWWQGTKDSVSSWRQAKENLISAYGDRRPPHRIYREIFSAPQQDENTDMFVAHIRALLARLPKGDIAESAQIDMTYGLLHPRIRKRLRREDCSSFPELLRLARNVEDAFDETRTPTTSTTPSANTQPPQHDAHVQSRRGRGAPAAAPDAQRQHTATPAPPAPSPPIVDTSTTAKQRPTCAYCKRQGHTKDQCRKLLQKQGESQSLTNSAEVHESVKNVQSVSVDKNLSFYCVQSREVRKQKPRNRRRNRNRKSYQCFSSKNSSIDSSNNNNNVNPFSNSCCDSNNVSSCFKNASVQCFCKKCRSSVNPLDDEHFRSRQVNPLDAERVHHDNFNSFSCQSATNANVPHSNSISRKCSDSGNRKQTDRHHNCCIPKCNNSNFMKIENVPLLLCDDCTVCSGDASSNGNHFQGPVLSIGRDLRPIFNIKILGFNGTALIDTAAKHCIAGYTLYTLLLRQGHSLSPSTREVRLADGFARTMDVLTTTLEVCLETTVITIPFLIFPESTNNETLLGIDFITAAGVVIDFHKEIWYFSNNSPVQFKLSFEPTSRAVSCASTDVLRDDEGTHLKPAERQALADILTRHADVFKAGGGPTPYAEHRIETGDHRPIAVPPYRLNPSKKQLMKAEIVKMLEDDIIEECESAWCSPALMVPKPNGDIRFCVDYRRLNAVTKADTYPMPRIDELLQSTKRDCYMSTLDLRSSHWQVQVKEADRDKTAFVCPLGTYRFKRMPLGLRNAPATFQRLIDRLRSCSSLQDVILLAYLNDLLVISQGYQQHLHDLEAVFNRLAQFNLHVNREKCVFARESVKYLGHVITQDGVSTDPGKVSAVLEMKEPGNLKHLRTFLQTCSWFRKLIPNFSKVAEPLTRLTRKSQEWTWGPDQTQAFNELKRLLTTAPILVQADFSRPFILRTDASNYALGAVLLQGDGNQERPIEYASRLLNTAERNYSTTEREALAVVWAVERFRPYLDGQPVIIGSDHQPLRWLLSLKSPVGKLVRWALKLQSFDIQFQYTPGKANVVADTLSRPVCSSDTRDSCGVCSVICDLPTKTPSLVRQEQLTDPEVEKIVKELEGSDDVAAQRWLERGYLTNQGVLYRYNPDSDSESPQLVIPAAQTADIIRELHDSPTACHPGIDRTYQKVAQLYYFTGMRRIITDYVKACIHCQRYKASNTKPPGLLQTPVMNQRNEVLAIDLFGPLPEGDQGERWILLVEDTATRWTELYALKEATAEACAHVLIEEYFMRFGLPRRIISDNGVQFISSVMRQCMAVLDIKQNFIPLYHAEANPAERKNRDLKAMLAHLVEDDHTSWPKKLPVIRFALNSAKCRTTGQSPAFLSFGREMRSPTEVLHDLRAVLDKENFVPQITPYLRNFLNSLSAVRERVEIQQDKTKQYSDSSRRPAETFEVGDLVLLKSHLLSKGSKDLTSKFFPRRDGPYLIVAKVSPTTYTVANTEQPDVVLGKYHTQDLTRYQGKQASLPKPVVPKRHRGRPAKATQLPVQERGRSPELEGEYIANRISSRPPRASRACLPARFQDYVSPL